MLHLVENKLDMSSMQRLLAQLYEEDTLVLLSDGVYMTALSLNVPCAAYVLANDLHDRGLEASPAFQLLTMDGLVELACLHSASATW